MRVTTAMALVALTLGGCASSLRSTEVSGERYERHVARAFELLMPMQEPVAAGTRIRSMRDSHPEVLEEYVQIRYPLRRGQPISALLVLPEEKSIRNQCEIFWGKERVDDNELLARVRVHRYELTEEACPALRQRVVLLSDIRQPMPVQEIVLHAFFYEIEIDAGGDQMRAILVDDTPLASWATETLAELKRCATSQGNAR